MKIISEPIPGGFLLEPTVFGDERGYFFESFNDVLFSKLTGANSLFVQDNQSMSAKGVLRGIHFQLGDSAQAKLVRVIQGSVWDVMVDLRPNSPTYKKWFGAELSAENKLMMYVPRGFGHGFVTLEDNTVFTYKCDNHYDREAELGLHYLDPEVGIDWPIDDLEIILSEKDKDLLTLNKIEDKL